MGSRMGQDVISEEAAIGGMLGLSVLPFFPTDPPARGMIVDELRDMCSNEEQLKWLVKRTVKLWSKWESLRELRAILCARFKPADGFEVGYSSVFPEGIVPPESPQISYTPIALPPGCSVTADEHLDGTIMQIAQMLEMPPRRPSHEELYTAVEYRIFDVDQLAVHDLNGRLPWRERKAEREAAKRLEEIITGPEDRKPIPLAEPAAPFRLITAEDIERAKAETTSNREERIRQAQETLANSKATEDEKFIAMEILRS